MIECIVPIYAFGAIMGTFVGAMMACDCNMYGTDIVQKALSTGLFWPLWTIRVIYRGVKRQWNE
ncbi:hypothetical protein KAR91_49925 [Candidatus Pacearchaeota archaeon]|nr:hypothetical protein [Candidatus Pacearchaeota archaeon]